MIPKSYFLSSYQHFLKKPEPFIDKKGSFEFRYLLESLFIERQTVTEFHHCAWWQNLRKEYFRCSRNEKNETRDKNVCSVTIWDDGAGTTIHFYLYWWRLKTEELSAWKPRETSVGPQVVIEFSGSKGRLLYKTTQKHRQTSKADKYEQTGNRRANMDINGPDHFRTTSVTTLRNHGHEISFKF